MSPNGVGKGFVNGLADEAGEAEKRVRRRTGGRSAKVRDAVLQAALQVLLEDGASGLSLNEIARRAGVHASSVMRRWGTCENVLLDAVLTYVQDKLPTPDTGSLRGDLIAFDRSMAAYLATTVGETVLRTLAAAEDNLTLADGRLQFFQSRYEALRIMLERAAERGELRPGIDPQIALILLVSPLHFRKLMARQEINDGFIEQVVDTLLQGLSR